MTKQLTRKQLGAWYTPSSLVEALVNESVFEGAVSVLDPACGDGRFLHATGLPQQVGVDLDPSTEFIRDDALTRDWGNAQFDVVIGNPPFLNQLATATTRGGSSRFGGGPYADAAAEFLALSMRLCRPGGRVGLVLPQSLLSARDATPIRELVDSMAALRWMWWSDTHMFDASVRVWAGVWEVGGQQRDVRRAVGPEFRELPAKAKSGTWAGLISDATPRPHNGPCLGDIATFSVDFRQHYYGLLGAIGDNVDGPPLVTSGLIEPGRCLWSERSARFAKHRYAAPRVALDRLSPSLQRWAATRLVPKVLIANQTKVIEAVHDTRGEWLPSVPVISAVSDDCDRVLRVLGSYDAHEWVHHHAAGSGLGAGTVRLSPALLAGIPLR